MNKPTAQTGLFVSLQRLLDTGLGILQLRLQLLGTELEAEKLRLLDALVRAALALLLIGLALVLGIGFVVLLFWDPYRLPAIGGLALLLGGAGGWLLQRARREAAGPEGGVFALSLGELQRDRDGLAPVTPSPAPAVAAPEK